MKIAHYPLHKPLQFAFIVSVAALGLAFVSQFLFGSYPCELCIYQRIPYALIATLSALGMVHACKHKPVSGEKKYCPYRFGLLAVLALLFFVEAALGWYHVSVEAGLLGSSCATQTGGGETLDELRAMIENAPIVSCSDVGADFLGVSMALWNALAAILFSAIFSVIIRREKRMATSCHTVA